MPNSHIFINPSEISASDRSAQYGDASFTTMYAQDGCVVLFSAHIERLNLACKRLNIAFSDWPGLREAISSIARESQTPIVIKVLISRGSGGRGYLPPAEQQPICVISSFNATFINEHPSLDRVGLSDIVLPVHSGAAEIKHNNRLAQVLAAQQARELGLDEVLMCDSHSQLIEASSANVFYQLDGCWYAPTLSNCGVKGIMRSAFIDYLQGRGMFVNQATHHIEQVLQAKMLLLSNAVKGIRPVATFFYKGQEHSFDTDINSLVTPFMEQLLTKELTA